MNFYDVIFAQQKTKADSKYFGEISDAINVLNGSEGTYLPSEMGAAIIDAIPTEEVTDDIVSVTDAAAYPAKGLEFAIEPVQEGSGDPSPTNVRPISGWTGVNGERTGKNLLNIPDITGESSMRIIPQFTPFTNEGGVYAFACFIDAVDDGAVQMSFSNGTTAQKGIHRGHNYIVLQSEIPDTATWVTVYCNCGGKAYKIWFGKGTPTSIPITLPTEAGTVYGGKVDVVNGKLLAYPEYDSYNGETLTGKWISSMDTYVAGTTPTIGAQVVDLSGAGTEYDITPQEVQMLLGDNNVWCDTGDTTLKYKVDLGRYIEKLKASQTTPRLSLSRQAVSLDAVGDVEPITQEIKSDASERKSAETEEQEKGGDAG